VEEEFDSSAAFAGAVREVTGGQPVQLGLNLVGGKSTSRLIKGLSDGAHFVTYGGMSKQGTTVGAGDLIFKDIHLDGFWASRWGERYPEEKQRTITHILQLYAEGKLTQGPMNEVKWNWETKKQSLVDAVSDTLSGFRQGKGIFIFEDT